MKLKIRILCPLLCAVTIAACGGETTRQRSQSERTVEANSPSSKPAQFAIDQDYDPEACSIARPGDCIPTPPSMTRDISICGYAMKVPILSYLACQGATAMLPASCTVGSALSAGGACAASFALIAGTCAVSVATVGQAAECCIKGGC